MRLSSCLPRLKTFLVLWLYLGGGGANVLTSHAESPPAEGAKATSSSARAVGVPHPFFWEVKYQRQVRAYLLGTMHVPDTRWNSFPQSLLRDLDSAQALYTEIDLKDKTKLLAQLTQRSMLSGGQTLEEIIGTPLFQRLDKYLKKYGKSALFMNYLHPKMVEVMLGLLDIMPLMQSGKPVLDEWLMQRAQAAGKVVGGVETVDEQIEALLGGSMSEAVSSLRFTLKRLEERRKEGKETFNELLKIYFSGDEKHIDRFMRAELKGAPEAMVKSMDRLLTQRNRVMARRIHKLLSARDQSRLVFAFGVAHFVGEGSVIELLKQRGYQIKRRFAPLSSPKGAPE